MTALPCWGIGFLICFFGFLVGVHADASSGYPIEGPTGLAAIWEIPWVNDTAGVFLMTIGWILLFKKVDFSGWFYKHVLLTVSKASYGMYLSHMMFLLIFSAIFREWLGLGKDGILGNLTTPVQIIFTAATTFICVAVVCVLLQRIPKIGKWLIG